MDEEKLGRLYEGYRDERYLRERNSFEPWYGEKQNKIGEGDEIAPRIDCLLKLLEQFKVPLQGGNVLDFGGADGRLISPLPCKSKYVFDISGVQPVEGVLAAEASQIAEGGFFLTVCAHVLEHVPDPRGLLSKVVSTVQPGGWVYAEVPDEHFAQLNLPEFAVRSWLSLVLRWKLPTMLVDFASTASRIFLRAIPPGGAPFLREHLTYFSERGLALMAERAGLEVAYCGKLATGHLGMLGKRRA